MSLLKKVVGSWRIEDRFSLSDVEAIKKHLLDLEAKGEESSQFAECPVCNQTFAKWINIVCEGETVSGCAAGVAVLGRPGVICCSRECAYVASLRRRDGLP